MDAVAKLQLELTAALAGLTAAETGQKPVGRPEKWSVQQIAEHLDLTYRSTNKLLQTRIEKKTATLSKPTLVQRVWQAFVLRLGYLPRGRTAPQPVTPGIPSVACSGCQLAEQIGASLQEMRQLMSQGEQIFGRRRAASHFVLGPLSMAQWGRFHLVHGRHHLRQIRAILRDDTHTRLS